MRLSLFTFSLSALLFWTIYCAWIIIEIAGSASQKSSEAAKIQDHGSVVVLIVAFYIESFLSFGCLWWFPGARISWNPMPLFCVGLILMLTGILLRQYAIRTLGHCFTRKVAIHSGQTVIQSGPYRFIRHPAYSGTMLTTLGFSLAMTNWASIVLTMLCFFLSYLYRIAVEERALCEYLGQGYVEYRQRTRLLIPFIF